MWHRLYYHLVWTTWLREPSIDHACAEMLSRFLRTVACRYRARILEIGATRTHVHVLLSGHPQTDFPKLVQHLKGGSSTVWNKHHADPAGWKLKWADGYGLSTVGWRQVDATRAYLRDQPRHHRHEAIEGWAGDRPTEEFLR